MQTSRIETKFGVFHVEQDTKMARVLASDTWNHDKETDLVLSMLSNESVVIDVGAHIGTFAIPAAKIARSVIAFEPVAINAAILRMNIQENAVQNIEVRECGLGNKNERRAASLDNADNTGGYTLHEAKDEADSIEIRTPDNEVTYATFIKIDVEGMEPFVLEGARALLEKHTPTLFFEVNIAQLRSHFQHPFARLHTALRGLGYKYHLVGFDGRLYRVPSPRFAAMLALPSIYFKFRKDCPIINVLATKEYMPQSASWLSFATRKALGYFRKK